MKPIVILASLLLCASACEAQERSNEFEENGTGLIYSATDLTALRFVVDSLHLKFKTCDLSRTYNSLQQARVFQLELSDSANNLKAVKKELEKGMDFATALQQYARYIKKTDTTRWVVDYSHSKERPHYLMSEDDGDGFDDVDLFDQKPVASVKGKWCVYYYPKEDGEKENSITAYYFPDEWSRQRLPDTYARLVQYVDCMVDTSATVYLTDDAYLPWEEKNKSTTLPGLLAYINQKSGQQKASPKNEMTEKQLAYALEHLRNDAAFLRLLTTVADECIKKNIANNQVEKLVGALLSKKKALDMRRSYMVMGNCSMDESPRYHALSIAKMAAEAHSWDVFLRAHLDIMNDRFVRVSDGSYAWEQRQTYLRELEVLDINVPDLILGLCLRAQPMADNHYQGTVWRLGKAIADSKDQPLFEQRILQMIKDEQLDRFNRTLLFLLYSSYVYRIPDVGLSNEKINALKANAATYPFFVQEIIAAMKLREKKKAATE